MVAGVRSLTLLLPLRWLALILFDFAGPPGRETGLSKGTAQRALHGLPKNGPISASSALVARCAAASFRGDEGERYSRPPAP